MKTKTIHSRSLGSSLLLAFAITLVLSAILISSAHAAPLADSITITVNSDSDSADANPTDDLCETANGNGVCTLRAAIQTANRDNDSDTINFDIPGGGVPKIQVASALPEITKPVILDGTTQASGWIELTATGYTFGADGFKISGGDSTVRGFVINGFYGTGIFIENGGNNLIVGNRIGTNVDGTDDIFNYSVGVYIKNSSDNQIGGTQEQNRNLISGNIGDGVSIYKDEVTSNLVENNKVKGNFIGTDVTGTTAIPNTGGIGVVNASNNVIGGDTENARNIISGNASYGIDITGTSSANVIKNNYIGTNVDGTSALANGDGIFIGNPDPDNQILNNLISGNADNGIQLDGLHAIVIQGNKIGTTADGNGALGNAQHGIEFTSFFHNPFVIGGDGANEGNIIRFNSGDGIFDGSTGLLQTLRNRISDNGGLGVDMNSDGVDANDNDEFDSTVFPRNYPVLTSAQVANGETTLQGTLHSEPNSTHRLDFYRNAACDASGYGEGDNYLGTYNTDPTDENGDLTFTATINTAAVGGEFITALNVSDGERNSEFSACVQVSGGSGNLGTYNIYDVDGEGYYNIFAPNAINNQTQFVYSLGGQGYLWFNQVSFELGLFPDGGTPVIPQGINASTQIVGNEVSSTGSIHGFLWQDGAMTDLGTLDTEDEYSSSWAQDINDAGVIVGSERHYDGDANEDAGGAAKWVNGSLTLLPHAPNCGYACGYDDAYAINNNGQIAGGAEFQINNEFCSNTCTHAALWDGSGLTILDDENYTHSEAIDINDSGQMVGYKVFHQQGYLAAPMLWNGGPGGTNLRSDGFTYGQANAINNNGVVVGASAIDSSFGYQHAFIWTQATGMVDLNTLLDAGSGWVLETAFDINDQGEIIGYGTYNGQGSGFLLRPSNLANLGGAPFVVNSTADAVDDNIGDDVCHTAANECTLRAAIQEANANADETKIYFNIPGGDIPKITPNPALPEITKPVIINGATQPDTFRVELSGENAIGNLASGLFITSGDSTVTGMVINRFNYAGIYLKTKGNNKVEGNFIGTDTTATLRRANKGLGIFIENSPNNMIGGTLVDQRNIISGNGDQESCADVLVATEGFGQSGISILGATSSGNQVQGNYIGTDVNGNNSVYNMCIGVGIGDGAKLNVIGGTTAAARNVIAGNQHQRFDGSYIGYGVYVSSGNQAPINNVIVGNYIGTNMDGTGALPNTTGVLVRAKNTVVGGISSGSANVISGNRNIGVDLDLSGFIGIGMVSGVKVQGNLIGLDKTGQAALGNGDGIHVTDGKNILIGGATLGARNLISGNTGVGILGLTTEQEATGIKIHGNVIGSDDTGAQNLGNGAGGVSILTTYQNQISVGGKNNGEGNVIAFNNGNGIFASEVGGAATPNVAIRANSIFNNQDDGIRVVPNGAVPTVGSSQFSSNKTKIKGTLNGDANKSYTLDFFSNTGCDAGEFGEGQTYLGSTTVTTNGSGAVDYEYLIGNVPSDNIITATATRDGKSSGSFSRCRTMAAAASQAYAAPSGDCAGNTPCYNSVNDAIDAADPDGTVNVAEGTYNEDIVLNGDVQLNMGEASGGGDCCDGNRADKKAARKAQRHNAEAATSAGDFILNGSLSILNGTFQAPSTNLYLSGNLTLQSPGNFNNNNGTIILNGSGAQNINGDFQFNNLTINSGVIADADDSSTNVNGTFLNNGVAKNSQTKNVNDPDFFKTFQNIAGRTSAKLLTTGNPDLGNMIVATNLNQTPQTSCTNGVPTNFVKRWYNLTRESGNVNGINATLRLYYDANELNGAAPETLKMYHCDEMTQQWQELATTRSSDSDGSYVQAENINSFSPFGLGGSGAPTNVSVETFKAKVSDTPNVHLTWRTGSELNVAGFNLWRAEKDGEYVQVNDALLPAQNPGGIGETKYEFDDANVVAGTTYNYVLEIVVTQGENQKTEPITVEIPNANCATPDAVTLLTPTNGEKTKRTVRLDWSDANCATTYELIVRHGGKNPQEIVHDETLPASQYELNKLAKGKYKWRVRACNANRCGEWSEWSQFVVKGKDGNKR